MSDTKIDDGGPAFPVEGHCVDASGAYCGDVVNSKGLSLRDWFAGQALAGLLGNNEFNFETEDEHEIPHEISRLCYQAADAMLAARNKKE